LSVLGRGMGSKGGLGLAYQAAISFRPCNAALSVLNPLLDTHVALSVRRAITLLYQ